MIVNNEVTLSRKNCKINTSQPPFRGLVVDQHMRSYFMLLKRTKTIPGITKFIRMRRTKKRENFCNTICKYGRKGCLGTSFCGKYIFHLEYTSKQFKKLKYLYLLEQ